MRAFNWLPAVVFRPVDRVWFGAVLLVLCFSFFSSAHAQNNNDEKKKSEEKDSKEKDDQRGGIIGDATRMLLDEHDARFFGNPHRFSILPIGYYDFRTGLNLGMFSRIESKQDKPYRYRVTLQFIASTNGSHKHKIVFEYPQIGHSKFGFKLRAEWERDLEARYFGLGNNSLNEKELTDPDREEFIDEDFYLYNLKQPSIAIYGKRQVLPNIFFWFGFGLEKADPQLKAGPETSFLAQDRPFGRLGGSGRHLSFRLSWDTRSDDLFPRKGFLTDFSFEPNFASVKEETPTTNGIERRTRDVTFYRYTFSDAHFFPFRSDRLIFANRVVFEGVAGNAPYYALGEVAGERHIHGLGGSHSLRGFQSRRFQDKLKLFTLTELRYNLRQFQILSHSFDLIFIGFFDTGRVWRRWSEIAFNDVHSTFGAGVWLNWNNKVIFRLDVGRSPEQIIPFFRFYTAF